MFSLDLVEFKTFPSSACQHPSFSTWPHSNLLQTPGLQLPKKLRALWIVFIPLGAWLPSYGKQGQLTTCGPLLPLSADTWPQIPSVWAKGGLDSAAHWRPLLRSQKHTEPPPPGSPHVTNLLFRKTRWSGHTAHEEQSWNPMSGQLDSKPFLLLCLALALGSSLSPLAPNC